MIQAHDFGQGHIGMKEDHANQAVLAEHVAKEPPRKKGNDGSRPCRAQ